MKALIISEDDSFINTFDSFFSKKGFNTIIYKWLLKALDNIEEIRPDCVILNSSEYPRHWKTLVQFIKSGIGGEKVAIFLYEPLSLSQEELSKAKILGITSHITDYKNQKELDELSLQIKNFFGIKEKKDEANTYPFVLLVPKSNRIISGNFIKQSSKLIKILDTSILLDLNLKDYIKYFSYQIDNKIINTSAKIYEIVNNQSENYIILELEE